MTAYLLTGHLMCQEFDEALRQIIPWLPLRLGWPVASDIDIIFHSSFASNPQVNEFRKLNSRRIEML